MREGLSGEIRVARGPRKELIIGASTGYGLATRIAAAFGARAETVGVFYERPADGDRTASAGWYNSAFFEEEARKADGSGRGASMATPSRSP